MPLVVHSEFEAGMIDKISNSGGDDGQIFFSDVFEFDFFEDCPVAPDSISMDFDAFLELLRSVDELVVDPFPALDVGLEGLPPVIEGIDLLLGESAVDDVEVLDQRIQVGVEEVVIEDKFVAPVVVYGALSSGAERVVCKNN